VEFNKEKKKKKKITHIAKVEMYGVHTPPHHHESVKTFETL
jgi:hypothetical protein